jgi:hypothetical protein
MTKNSKSTLPHSIPVHTETPRPWPGQMHLKCTRRLAIINHDLLLYRILSHTTLIGIFY